MLIPISFICCNYYIGCCLFGVWVVGLGGCFVWLGLIGVVLVVGCFIGLLDVVVLLGFSLGAGWLLMG